MERPLPHILEKIRATKLREIDGLLASSSIEDLVRHARERLQSDLPRGFYRAVAKPLEPGSRPNVIAEVKKASPSKGIIRPDFDPVEIARAYEEAGAAAISCLTDHDYFQGHLDYLRQVRETVKLPVLRKDFLIHPAQILEACAAGADAVLLIARMLGESELKSLYDLATKYQMDVLMEIHDEQDLEKAMLCGAKLVGINNRDLDTFVVDMQTTPRLQKMLRDDIAVVSESGISSGDEMDQLAVSGVRAVLVGESLCRQPDVEAALRTLRGI